MGSLASSHRGSLQPQPHHSQVKTMEKHTTWIAYLWSTVMAFFGHFTLEDYATITGIVGIVATFLLNRHYKRREAEIGEEKLKIMRRRNQILEHLVQHPQSAVSQYLMVAETPESEHAEKDSKPA